MTRSLLCMVLGLAATTAFSQNTTTKGVFNVYLIGDTGEPFFENVSYKKYLQDKLNNEATPSVIIFLGDNIYPKGMPLPGEAGRANAEKIVREEIELVKDVKGSIYFVPGNHDWKQGRAAGWAYIQEQQRYVDSLRNDKVIFIPKGGCPGPVEVPLAENVVLIVLDTQWLLHQWTKPEGENSSCDAKSATDVLVLLEDMLRRNQGKRVIVAGHHPVYTYGVHGGYYPLKTHLFPLTDVNASLYIPLPVLGSVYSFYRKVIGNIQDVSNPYYKQFASGLGALLKQYPGTIYAAGHEHGLQYIPVDSVHYIVSGAGVKTERVRKKGHSEFAAEKVGFVEVKVNAGGAATLDYVSGDQVIFTKNIAPPQKPKEAVSAYAIVNDSAIVKASSRYAASRHHEKWLGANYRDEWSKEIKVPVFDIGKAKGGLKIIQRGGGMQTLSLRLEDSVGHEFTLRSIEKFPEKAVPEQFRKTFVQDLVQDQISAAHPYGATVVPYLATAAGIYHTNPIVVYIPNDPRFGVYQKDLANQLMLFEERPAGNGKGMEFFGNADKIVGFDKLQEKLAADNDNRVDQEFVLRSRIFDLWIGDWDRHDDQWRWAEFTDKKGSTFRPIPRDRDQAFFVNEGKIPKLWSHKWAMPKFEGFDDKIDWPSGLAFNARYFDRSFLTEVPREEWKKIADDVAARMTDEVIESSIHRWPKEIFDLHGEEIIRKLKARRANLATYALDHYAFLAKGVDVLGSDKGEVFEIEHQANGDLKIQMFKKSKSGEKGKKLYDRTFLESETDEVRLYGRGGDDNFIVKGSGSRVKVRVIGGDGKDNLEATDRGGKTYLYDSKDGAVVNGSHFKDRRSTDPNVNLYDHRAFKYDVRAPLVFGNYNPDDGLFIGGGFLFSLNGFRKDPFREKHLLLATVALNTGSFNVRYDGRFRQALGKWDLEVDADIKSPNYVNNFFGWGNESVFDKNVDKRPGIDVENSINYYRVRFREYALQVKASRKIGQSGFIKVGPAFQHVGIVKPRDDRYISEEYAPTLSVPIFDVGKFFAGAAHSWGFDKRNNTAFPLRGVYFEQSSRWMKGLRGSSDFASHKVNLSLYQSFRFPVRLVFAFRAGGGINQGTYEFYQAQILDGKTEIRGFRKTRFYGDSKLYFNNEVRLKLIQFKSYVFPANLGIHGFYDVGRVWYKDASGQDPTAPTGTSNTWHKGYGGGIWFTPYQLAVLTTEVGHSVEGTLFYIRMGFLF